MSDSLLTVVIRHRVGTVSLDLNFALTQPWTVLFGPSGSGKTTVLRAIAGFVRPDAGKIESANGVFFDSAARIFVPPHMRRGKKRGANCAVISAHDGITERHLWRWMDIEAG